MNVSCKSSNKIIMFLLSESIEMKILCSKNFWLYIRKKNYLEGIAAVMLLFRSIAFCVVVGQFACALVWKI